MVKNSFTLIEIIVVLVIIMMVTGIAVSSLRGESPSAALNRHALEIEAYLAKVRFLCAENGRDYVVRLYPDENMFCAHMDYSEEELENMDGEITSNGLAEKFVFPENVELFTVEGVETVSMEQDFVELFRFYPSGGASCVNRPGIRIKNLAKVFDISFFSGQLVYDDGDGVGVEKR